MISLKKSLEIMERMNSYKETAFDKLYRWTQTETRTLGRESLEVPVTMRQALKALKQRPFLFQYVINFINLLRIFKLSNLYLSIRSCLEELVHIRRNTVSRTFMDAL